MVRVELTAMAVVLLLLILLLLCTAGVVAVFLSPAVMVVVGFSPSLTVVYVIWLVLDVVGVPRRDAPPALAGGVLSGLDGARPTPALPALPVGPNHSNI